MRRSGYFYLLFIISVCFFIPIAFADPEIDWTKTYGGAFGDSGSQILQTSDRGYLIAGSTDTLGGDVYDFYLVKTDRDGNLEWSKTYGGVANDQGGSICKTGDGGYILVGLTESFGAGGDDVYLIKTDSDGNEEWSKTFGGVDHDNGYSVQITRDNGYIISADTHSFGAGSHDVYLIKTDQDGNEEWSNTYGGAFDDRGLSVIQTNRGQYLVNGITDTFGAGLYDFYLIKTDSYGNMLWSQTYGDVDEDMGVSVIQTNDGGYALTGVTGYDIGVSIGDVWLIKIKNEYPPKPLEYPPNPGRVFYERGATYSDSVSFCISLRDMNKTKGRSSFTLTILDQQNNTVYTRVCSIRKRTNWYVFYLNTSHFTKDEYTIYAVSENWNTGENIRVR